MGNQINSVTNSCWESLNALMAKGLAIEHHSFNHQNVYSLLVRESQCHFLVWNSQRGNLENSQTSNDVLAVAHVVDEQHELAVRLWRSTTCRPKALTVAGDYSNDFAAFIGLPALSLAQDVKDCRAGQY